MIKAENLLYSYDNGVKKIDAVLDNLNIEIKKGGHGYEINDKTTCIFLGRQI